MGASFRARRGGAHENRRRTTKVTAACVRALGKRALGRLEPLCAHTGAGGHTPDAHACHARAPAPPLGRGGEEKGERGPSTPILAEEEEKRRRRDAPLSFSSFAPYEGPLPGLRASNEHPAQEVTEPKTAAALPPLVAARRRSPPAHRRQHPPPAPRAKTKKKHTPHHQQHKKQASPSSTAGSASATRSSTCPSPPPSPRPHSTTSTWT